MPKLMLNYRPNGRRRLGRPLKRLWDEAETSLTRPNCWRMMMVMIMLHCHSVLNPEVLWCRVRSDVTNELWILRDGKEETAPLYRIPLFYLKICRCRKLVFFVGLWLFSEKSVASERTAYVTQKTGWLCIPKVQCVCVCEELQCGPR
jgi:hypothetical protein